MAFTFDTLWNAYPVDYAPCRNAEGTPNFENQCAIRVGMSLRDGGADLSQFHGVYCWYGHSQQHVLRGEELAAWLAQDILQFGHVDVRRNSDASTYLGLRGLMFCRNFWGPGNQGDHIDLWDRSYLKMGDASYILRSEEVWFWNIDAVQPRTV
jgi:hypothetical protein